MKIFKYECYSCGSTDIAYKRRIDDIIDLTVKSGCRNCGSKEIQPYIVLCDECDISNLFFDDIRYEIVCTHCGLVHASTDVETKQPLGFLLRRPNLKF